jgi:tetratricopeptide (TPR) repeat protein
MVQVDPSTRFTDLTPIRSEPPQYHFFGCGLYLYGDRDFDVETQSFVRTLCFCLLYIPLIPMAAYRAAPAFDGWRYLGRVPVSGGARLWSLILCLALLGAGGALGAHAVWNTPWRVAARQMEDADRCMAEGRVGDAAGLLASVAQGPTDRAAPASRRLAGLLDHPTTKRDSNQAMAVVRAAAGVQRSGRWPSGLPSVARTGEDVARSVSASDVRGALLILEEVEGLGSLEPSIGELRHELLEKVVAANPSDPEWASRLAVDCEARGQLDRCEKILEPLRARLGELEGARVLGLADARANRIDRALPLLRGYTRGRLRRLADAEARLQRLYREGQQRVIKQLEDDRPADFDYSGYRRAGEARREAMVIQYVEGKLKGDPAIAASQQALVAESGVVPVALELGVILLQHAQGQSDPRARKPLLDEAEATFLAVSRMAGQQAEFQMSLARVNYWQGKHAEGRKILDEVLGAHHRDPALLVQAADVLRNVGSESEARALAEEAYNKATVPAIKSQGAVMRGLMGDDVDDQITWLERANTDNPFVKAILCDDRASQALSRGSEAEAIANLKQAISIYETMPESTGVLNNLWISLSQLARLTGDVAAHDRGVAMVQRAAQLAPGDGLALVNASEALIESGVRGVIGDAIDLRVLRRDAGVDLLDFLVQDERGRAEIAARLRSNPLLTRALAMKEKVILLSPRNPDYYESFVRVLERRRDGDGLRKLLSTLGRTELDLSDNARRERENESGAKDRRMKEQAAGALSMADPIVPVSRARGGPTFAAAVRRAIDTRIRAAEFGMPTDPDALVALGEEAVAKSPSVASRYSLLHALFFRAADRLARDDARFGATWRASFRSISTEELIAAMLSVDGPLKQRVRENPDLDRALGILHALHAACPSLASGPRSWALMRDKFPGDAASIARTYFGNDWDELGDEARARLKPYDASTVLTLYWKARMQGRDAAARSIVKDARAQGIPVPIEIP